MTYYKCKTCGWEGEVKSRPRCLACARKRTVKWHKENREKSRAQARRYDKKFRLERPEEYNTKRRRYRKQSTNQKQRLKRLKWLLDGDVTREQLIEIYERDKVCIYCGKKVKPRFTVTDPRGFDHSIPRINGGKHTASNIVVCCRQCNELKGGKNEIHKGAMDNRRYTTR